MQAPRNQWYCAAFGYELTDKPLGRMFLDEPVVMYRKADGRPVAFEDRCCHRRAPLSEGKIEGDNLRCGYHGFLYEPSGVAVWAPGQERMPSGARVRSYPIIEKHGWIWIWMGDPVRVDPITAPNYDKYDDPKWVVVDELISIRANYFLVVDNLLDLSHLPFLHAATIGSPEDVDPKLSWERGADWVKGLRVSRGLSPSAHNIQAGFDFRFDRTQIILFEPPSQVTIDILSNEHGKEYGDPTGRMNHRMIIYDAITPETQSSCFYFSAIARDFTVGRETTPAKPKRGSSAAFQEDKRMLEAEQRIINLNPAAPQVDVVGDVGGLQARRLIEGLLAQEGIGRAAE